MADSDDRLDMMLDSPKKSIIQMFLVVSLMFIAIKVNGFLDVVWIARLSDDAAAAVSLVNPIYSIVAALGVGVGTGSCVCISYRLGKKDFKAANELTSVAIYLGLIVAIPAILFLVFGTEMMFNNLEEQNIKALAKDYVIPLAVGAPALIMAGIVTNFLKSEGAMKAVTACSLLSIPVNAILTPVLVYVLGMGIAGASIATVLGSVATTLAAVMLLKSGRYHINPRLNKPSIAHIREVLGVGGPKTIEEFLGAMTFLVQNIILVTKLGGDAVAIHSISFSVIYLFTILSDSLGAAALPVCSAAAGARRVRSMRSSMIFSFLVLLGLSAVVLILLQLFTPQIVDIFSDEDSEGLEDNLVKALELYAMMIPFYLLTRLVSPMMQILRKAHLWAVVYLVLCNMQVILLYFYATDIESMTLIVMSSTISIGVVGLLMTHYFTAKYNPDIIDEMIERGKGIPEIIEKEEQLH